MLITVRKPLPTRVIGTLIVFAGLGACYSPPAVEPPLAVPDRFRAPHAGELPSSRWWTAFADPDLDKRIARALEHNFTLRSAWDRLRAARALVRVEGGAKYPSLGAVAEGRYTRADAGSDKQWELGLAAAYEVDLWGRIDAAIQAEAFRAEAAFLDHQAAAQTLAAAVARTYFQWIEAMQQRALLLVQLEANQRAYESLRNRFGGGLVGSADLLRQRQLIEGTREDILVVESAAAVLRHALAVLEGRAPQEAESLESTVVLPELPPMPGTGIPADLLARRPDVQSALFDVRASNADLAVAMAERYPRLTLTASATTAAASPSALFEDWIGSIAAGLFAPLFQGGSLDAEVERNEALVRGRVLAYGQAVLEAFREVEDALVRERKQVEIIANLSRQAELSETAFQRLRLEYLNGVSNFLDVLSAQIAAQQLQRDLVQAQRVLLGYRIDLYRALAGNFEDDREALDALYGKTKTESP